MTDFGIFDTLRVKISTLPHLCFMIYYIVLKLKKYKKIEIPKKYLYPPFGRSPQGPQGLAPRGSRGLTKCPRDPLSPLVCVFVSKCQKKIKNPLGVQILPPPSITTNIQSPVLLGLSLFEMVWFIFLLFTFLYFREAFEIKL